MGIGPLDQSVINDTEAQLSGDVETPWVELVDRLAPPAVATDKASLQLYSIGQEMRVRNQAGVEINISDRLLSPAGAFPFQGNINAAADFPLPPTNPAGVQNGWTFFIQTAVTDNNAARTNTTQVFPAGAVVSWNGVNWSRTDQGAYRQYEVATPVTVGEGDLTIIEVATTTIGAPSVVNLPALAAAIVGKKVLVIDSQGAAATNPITLTRAGGDLINGAATLVLNTNFGGAMVEAVQTGVGTYAWVIVTNRTEQQAATARLVAIGSGRSQCDSRQLAAGTEILRVFRALAAGRILSCSAETGTVAAAGESMTFDVTVAAATCLTAPILIDNTIVVDTPVAGVLAAHPAFDFAAGQLIAVSRVYVAGGGATPMRDTVVDIEVQFD